MPARIPVLALLLVLLSHDAWAQPAGRAPRESAYLEFLAPAGLLSVNLDLTLPSGVGVRAGTVTQTAARPFCLPCDRQEPPEREASFLAAVYVLVGEGPHRLEVAAGTLLPVFGRGGPMGQGAEGLAGLATVGYRHQPLGAGPLVRVGLTPLWTGSGLRLGASASLGLAAR